MFIRDILSKIRNKKIAYISTILVFFIILFAIIYSQTSNKKKDLNYGEMYEVHFGQIQQVVHGDGPVKQSIIKNIDVDISSYITIVHHEVGDTVSAGDILFELDALQLDALE